MGKKLQFDANLPGLLDEILCNNGTSILKMPIQIVKCILVELAELAVEIDDPRLHKLMLRLGLYECTAAERVARIKELDGEIREAGNVT